MTKSEAIQNLLECDWLERACKNIGKHDWDELQQEFWVKILSLPDDTFATVHNLQFFCVRVMLNLYTSKWHRKVIPVGSYHLDEFVNQETDSIEGTVLQKDAVLGKLPMYDRVIFKLHERGVSCRKISEFTKINRKEVTDTVNRVKKHIQANVRYQPGTN